MYHMMLDSILDSKYEGILTHNLEDFGMDSIIKKLLAYIPDDLVTPRDEMESHLRSTLSQTLSADKIKDVQEAMKYLIEHPELRKSILKEVKERNSYRTHHNLMKEGIDFFRLVKGTYKNLDGNNLPTFLKEAKEKLKRYIETPEFKKLEDVVEDITNPAELTISNFREGGGLSPKIYANIDLKFNSGRIYDDFTWEKVTLSGWTIRKEYIDGEHLCIDAAEVILAARKHLKQLSILYPDIEVKFKEGDERSTITARRKSPKFSSIIKHLIKKTPLEYKTKKEVTFKWHKYNTEIDLLKVAYFASEDLSVGPEDIREFMIDMRYLAAAAELISELSDKTPWTFPQIVEEGGEIKELYNLELLLYEKNVVPNDFESGRSLLTGPNNGGKTTFMNSIALAQILFQNGWPIPAREAKMSIKDKVISHYIRPSDIRIGESRFANECTRMRDVLEEATPNSLILVDEMATGTNPKEGKEIAKVWLKGLAAIGADMIVTTHYNLSQFAEEIGLENIHDETIPTDNGGLEFTYKIVLGPSNISNAWVIAREAGVDEEGIQKIIESKKEIPANEKAMMAQEV